MYSRISYPETKCRGGVGPSKFYSPPPPEALQSLGGPGIRQSSSIQDGLWRLRAYGETPSHNFEKRLPSSSCLPFCPHGTTRLLLYGFLRNLIRIFRKFVENIEDPLKYANNRTSHVDRCTAMVSRSILLRMTKVSDKSCTEN